MFDNRSGEGRACLRQVSSVKYQYKLSNPLKGTTYQDVSQNVAQQ